MQILVQQGVDQSQACWRLGNLRELTAYYDSVFVLYGSAISPHHVGFVTMADGDGVCEREALPSDA